MKKIIFYGNCQLGAIAKYFRQHLLEFEVLLSTDCGLETFWHEEGLFAVWTKNNQTKQNEYKKCIHSKIRECDIFIFQDHSGEGIVQELRTQYLINNIVPSNAQKICMPDVRLFIHMTDARCLKKHIQYAKTKFNDPLEIIDFLQNSSDPHLINLMHEEFPINKKYEKYRNENQQRYERELKIYDTRINMLDFIENEYKNQILSNLHSHVSESYFIELTYRLLREMNVKNHNIKSMQTPTGGNETLDPKQFKFFRDFFPNIDSKNLKGRKMEKGDLEYWFVQ